ncbi:MAG: hypothetical protein WCX23_00270 [Candidatus Paceibacterota bacterium]|jgi:type VI protein secretion system component VasK|nr:hypothetical protein [Candidatus Paceibacterota bacterium]
MDKTLKKVQSLPKRTRKIIFWAVLIFFAFVLIWLWLWRVDRLVKNFDSKKIFEGLDTSAVENNIEKIQDSGREAETLFKSVNGGILPEEEDALENINQ